MPGWRASPASIAAAIAVAMLMGVAVPPAHAADAAYGEYLASECSTCHRLDGKNKGIPSITGWPADQFVAVLNSYKLKDRTNATMQAIAGRLTDEDMAALAAYYGGLKQP